MKINSLQDMVNDHMGNLAGSGRWRLPLHDLIFGADSGTGRLPRQRAKKRKRVKRSGVAAPSLAGERGISEQRPQAESNSRPF